MPAIKISKLGKDIFAFLEIAEVILKNQTSLRQTAVSLGVSTTAVTSCIKHLETHWDCKLLISSDRSGTGLCLSDQGIAIYRMLLELKGKNTLKARKPIRFHVSHSLITSQLLTPALSSWVSKLGDAGRGFRPRTEMDFSRVISGLQNDELDFAITWAFPKRLNDLPPGIEHQSLGPKLGMVLVCSSLDLLHQVTHGESYLDNDILLKQRIVGLSKERQPRPESLPNDWYLRANFLEVDTFDAAVAFVRSSIADVAFVPAAYADLNRYQSSGQLFYWTVPDFTVQVIAVTKRGGRQQLTQEANGLLDTIQTSLSHHAKEARFDKRAAASFPQENRWFEEMRFGYYLESCSKSNRKKVWKWEHVLLQRMTGCSDKIRLNGRMQNCVGAVFDFEHAELLDDVFYVVARKANIELSSVESFISLFTTCFEREGIMYGLWAGLDGKKQSTFQGTVWSHNALELPDLLSIVNSASVAFVLNSNEAVGFDQQISTRGMFEAQFSTKCTIQSNTNQTG